MKRNSCPSENASPHSFTPPRYARVCGQESSSWYSHDQNRSFQHRSCGHQMDHHPRSSTTRHHPSYHRTSAQFHRKREVWRCRTEGQTADRIHARMHQEGVPGEGGSSGCIRHRKVAVSTARAGTDSGGGRCWPRWMGPRVVCSSRR